MIQLIGSSMIEFLKGENDYTIYKYNEGVRKILNLPSLATTSDQES